MESTSEGLVIVDDVVNGGGGGGGGGGAKDLWAMDFGAKRTSGTTLSRLLGTFIIFL